MVDVVSGSVMPDASVLVEDNRVAYIEAGCRDFSMLAVAESWESAVEHAAAVRHRLIEVAGTLPAGNLS